MTNELEKQFFDTFGIEPMPYCCYHDCNCPIEDVGKFNKKCPKQAVTEECDARIMQKPQITDRILLELIIILGTICTVFDKNVDDLKENVLKNLIELSGRYHIYNPVRKLFEEE